MRRGFAMAVVLLLGAIVALMAGVMLQRHGSGRLNVTREIGRYQAHHAGRGLTEATWAWVQNLPSDGVRKMINQNGHAFDLHLSDGARISIYLRDAQGSIMANADTLSGRDREAAAGMLVHLRNITGSVIPEDYLRQLGPTKVSSVSAPPAVLEAVAMQASEDGDGVDQFVSEVLKARQNDDFKDLHVTQAITKAGMSPTVNAKLRGMLTADPTLWVVRAEIIPRGETEPTDAYEGLAQIETRGGRRGSNGTFSPWGPFLSWERVDVDPVGLSDGG